MHSAARKALATKGIDPITQIEREAIDDFALAHGRTWKEKLRDCMMRADYPRMTSDHAAILHALRNRRGVSFLTNYRRQPKITTQSAHGLRPGDTVCIDNVEHVIVSVKP